MLFNSQGEKRCEAPGISMQAGVAEMVGRLALNPASVWIRLGNLESRSGKALRCSAAM